MVSPFPKAARPKNTQHSGTSSSRLFRPSVSIRLMQSSVEISWQAMAEVDNVIETLADWGLHTSRKRFREFVARTRFFATG